MEVIEELFPNAQYVYVIRDGRDVALSLRKIHFGPKNMYMAAEDWKETIAVGDRFAESLPEDRLTLARHVSGLVGKTDLNLLFA